jgi:hypothetical protein
MSTEQHGLRLATHPTQHRIDPRMQHRRRLAAFIELWADAARKPAAVYALTRKDPRCKLPDEKQRTMIHNGIRDGMIARARIIRYRAAQLLDDLAQFPEESCPNDLTYVQTMLETAEAIEALTIAKGMPTEANRVAAVRETREAIATSELHCHLLLTR